MALWRPTMYTLIYRDAEGRAVKIAEANPEDPRTWAEAVLGKPVAWTTRRKGECNGVAVEVWGVYDYPAR